MLSNFNHNWTDQSPFERFFDFIAPNADRYKILFDHIEKLKLNSVVITINDNRHFFIFPGKVNLSFSRGDKFPFWKESPVILTAHYDRVPGSPGANDNSAAVFMLLKAAMRLDEIRQTRWIVIFTDKEELEQGEEITKQGSYSLAKNLLAIGLANAQIFNFDACGTGDTFVFSNTVDYLLNKNDRSNFERTSKIIANLRYKVLSVAHYLNISKALLAPVPFSDDAGFLHGGIPAQTITMLPAAEANPFASHLRSHPNFTDKVIYSSLKNSPDIQFIPQTWRYLNSPEDIYLHLTPAYYDKITRFAVELCCM
ncbi:MAG: M28 family metallopeptidase [Treponema sp.]|nr:M28 family metallopeptidase [Treponema sp.]